MKYLFLITVVLSSCAVSAQSSWKGYNQHGYYLELPDYFLPVASQDPGVDVFVNSNNKEITLRVETTASDQLSFNSKYLTEIGNGGVTYKLIKDTVYTVSYADDNTVNYHKSFISGSQVHTLLISYPNSQKTQFDLILQRIGRSFK